MKRALGSFEYQILSILIQSPQEYGSAIHRRLSAKASQPVNVGAVATALSRLEAKGFLTSQWGDPLPQRGGRRKRHYEITGSGREAFHRTAEIFSTAYPPKAG